LISDIQKLALAWNKGLLSGLDGDDDDDVVQIFVSHISHGNTFTAGKIIVLIHERTCGDCQPLPFLHFHRQLI